MVEVAQGDVRWCGGPNCRIRQNPATAKHMHHNLKQNTRVADAKDSSRILSERNRFGLDRGHVGTPRSCHGGTGISIRALTAIACSGRAESGLHMPRMKMSWNVVRWHSRKTSMPSNTSKLVGTNFNNATSKGLLLRPNTLTSGDPSGVTPCSATGMWSPTA